MRSLPVAIAALLALALAAPAAAAPAAKNSSDSLFKASTFKGLAFRSIGPAFTSGRVIDMAVDPHDARTWYVAAASGNVWKTSNAGVTWTPVFDHEGSYSIGCVTVDPKNPLVVWVGTGENNSQRSVSYGDGVYKSVDGGRHWKNMGLKESEHIGMIVVDPRNSDRVYVAAQGPLWRDGGDRGLYETRDGGRTWKKILDVDARTGVSELHLDPRDPDVMYASTYERHRRVWTLIDGGPGSSIRKSTDGGKTWVKLSNGLPHVELGRIGLAVSPANPDIVYAIIEARDGKSGFFRSTDAGGNWKKMSGYISSSPQYYQELVPDPKVADRVYSLDTYLQVTTDGGKTWNRAGEKDKHVDNHVLWIDPADTDHLIAGCDGGLYESFDRAATWRFFENLPVTQFYDVAVDDSKPFYFVYGGTQDNNTLGGPSRTTSRNGIPNEDWFVATGGDGFHCAVDPEDPNIVYAESQFGNLVRFDRKSGQRVGIQPQIEPGDPPAHWNWDSPLLISPHSHTRIYFGSQRLYRSDDRGDTWQPVSPDLTRGLDPNKLDVAGRVWSVDAVAKNASTSVYGGLVAISESPLVEGLLYAGTDDGLVQVSEDGGGHWRRDDRFPGVPEMSYVSDLLASRHDKDVVYAAFDNRKNAGDFKPYLLKSTDRGRSWKSIAGNLPERGTVYSLAEDSENPDLLFAGTEFGAFFTVDGGRRWTQLEGGLPTIQVRDMKIQRRENDLVLATFGRGFYVLDDVTPLRGLSRAVLEDAATLFPVRTALAYVPDSRIGGRGKGSKGATYFTADNPPFGAVFTYYLRDGIKTLKAKRQAHENRIEKKGGDVEYPSWDSLRAEDREEKPAILLTVTDQDGHVVRRLTGPVGAGFHRVAWDLRWPPPNPTTRSDAAVSRYRGRPQGPYAATGTYQVALAKRVDGVVTSLGEPQTFEVVPLDRQSLPAPSRDVTVAFARRTSELQRAVLGAIDATRAAQQRIALLEKALDDTPAAPATLAGRARKIEIALDDAMVSLTGDPVLRRHFAPAPPSIQQRVGRIIGDTWNNTAQVPETDRHSFEVVSKEFTATLATLHQLIDTDLPGLEQDAEAAGAPWTPGRLPEWKGE